MNFPKGKWIKFILRQALTKDSRDVSFYQWDFVFLKDFECEGVYTIWNTNSKNCLYIGSSNNLRSRIIDHIMNNKNLKNRDMYVKIRKDKYRFERLTLEARLIYKLNPAHNKQYIRRSTKEEIKQDIKKLTEDLKPILSGKEKRLIHDDKDKDLIQVNKSHCSNTSR